MMRGVLVFFVFVLAFSAGARAEPFSIELGHESVDITTGFTGSVVNVFGVKREKGQMALILEGLKREVVVRRKDNFFGAWLNQSWLVYKDVPQYYSYAMEAGLDEGEYAGVPVGIDVLEFEASSDGYTKKEQESFHKALVQLKQEQKLFSEQKQTIHYIDDVFFRARFYIPANVPTGRYVLRGLLIRKGEVVHVLEKEVKVEQVGFNADVFKFAHERAFLYALGCVLLAFLAGWVSNKIVRKD